MGDKVVSVERVIKAPASAIFAIVADASRHPEIDGSGSVKQLKPGAAAGPVARLDFGMSMKLGVPYSMSNKVVEYEPDKRIAWQTTLSGPLGRFVGGRIWRYELEAAGDGTQVARDVGHHPGQAAVHARDGAGGQADGAGHDQDARTTGGADRVPVRMTSGTGRPAMTTPSTPPGRSASSRRSSEYTRIPCLSPAFDPDWAERGAIAAAAELLRDWVRAQDGGAHDRDRPAARAHAGAARRQRRRRRADRHLRPHGQAAAARPMARGPRPLRAGAPGRPALRARHGGRRLLDVRRRDGAGGGGRRARPRPRPHRGERGERQPRPGGVPRASGAAHRDAAPRRMPRLGRAQLRPPVADDVVARDAHRDGDRRRADRGHPQRAGRRGGAVVVPHLAAHPVGDRGRGGWPHPPARAHRGGDARRPPGQPRAPGGGVPRQRLPDRRRAAPARRGPRGAAGGAHVGRRARGRRAPTGCPSRSRRATCCGRRRRSSSRCGCRPTSTPRWRATR